MPFFCFEKWDYIIYRCSQASELKNDLYVYDLLHVWLQPVNSHFFTGYKNACL